MKRIVSYITSFLLLSATILPTGLFSDPVSGEEAVDIIAEGEEKNDSDKEDDSDVDKTKWHLNLHEAAQAEFTDDKENREYLIDIQNPGGEKRGGVDKWDVQFRIRGFSIEEGHEYTVTYRISSSHSGSYYTKISNLDSSTVGDAVAGEVWHNQYGVSTMKSYLNGIIKDNKETSYGDGWSLQKISQGDTINVTCSFTGIASIPEAEWAFFLGGAGETTPTDCFAPGAVLRFSNLTLTDNTTGEKLVSGYAFVSSDVSGDITGDGVADMTDLSMLSLALIGEITLDDAQIDTADVNKDSIMDIRDLAMFQRYISGRISSLDKE